MKLQHKLLALAVMGLAAAAPAQAKIAGAAASPGNGELFLSVWHDNGTVNDDTDDVSYTRDLGTTLNTWAGAASPFALSAVRTAAGYVESYAADSKLTNFLNTFNQTTGAVLKWNLAGGDTFATDRILTTVNGAVGAPPAPNALGTIGLHMDTHLGAVNALADSQNATPLSTNAINNSNTATFANGNAFAGGVIWGDDLGGLGSGTAFSTTAGLGQSLNFYMLYQAAPAATSTSVSKFTDALNPLNAAIWQLASNGTLTYSVAAVPEADTWAMFAAGLLAVGAIARRRMAA